MSETAPAVPFMAAPATETPEPTAPEAQPGQQQPVASPPWGDDFTPEVAWEKIQKANREAAALRQRVISPEQQKQLEEYGRLVEASKSEAQRQQEALEAANRVAADAQAEAVRYKVAATYGIPADHFDLLGSGSEEDITARAEKIAALLKAQEATAPPPVTAPVTRPVEQMRPGATPGGTENEDDVILTRLGFLKPAS